MDGRRAFVFGVLPRCWNLTSLRDLAMAGGLRGGARGAGGEGVAVGRVEEDSEGECARRAVCGGWVAAEGLMLAGGRVGRLLRCRQEHRRHFPPILGLRA
jgi:hypothetical protein